jgi:hypothetical protein
MSRNCIPNVGPDPDFAHPPPPPKKSRQKSRRQHLIATTTPGDIVIGTRYRTVGYVLDVKINAVTIS